MNDKIIWIGNRESEIRYSTLFYKSITRYGSNKGNNISRNNNYEKPIIDFFIDNINKELENDNIKLFFYSNKTAELVIEKAPHLAPFVINKYNKTFLNFIENKTYAHLWAGNMLPIIEFTEMFGNECKYSIISKKFRSQDKFVIQKNYSSGGTGTLLLTKDNEQSVVQQLRKHECYLISPYYENSYSINVHIIISNDYISVLPGSIQIIENIDNHLLYKGADFIAYKGIAPDIHNKVVEYAAIVGKSLYNNGYIGICGLDLLVAEHEVFFIEVNTRFQASSMLINYALKYNGLPDLQTIVYNIYNDIYNQSMLKAIETMSVGYSMLSFYQTEKLTFNTYLLKLFENNKKNIEELIIENMDTCITNDYMFRVIFRTNISSVSFDNTVFVYQNLLNYSNYTVELYQENKIALKCALLTQGVRLTESVYDFYSNGKTIKKATFDAIDITIGETSVINCPIKLKFGELSPFSIKREEDKTILLYQDQYVYAITIAEQENLPIKYTKNSIDIHRIGYLTTDRLRIKHTSSCVFKRKGLGCSFCHITCTSNIIFPLEDIYETISCYQKNSVFRHFLIGGPSNTYENEAYYVEKIARYIRSISNKPIYVMSIPPINLDVLTEYHMAGVTEIAFNIEIFNRAIAKAIMPGKGDIPIEQYEAALKKSSLLFGVQNTRSMLIIGLDSKESFFKGIEYLCQMGVTPMISPFRPMEDTLLKDFVPPTIEYILDAYNKAKEICEKYQIELGPQCTFCQNNTLT